MVIVIIVALVVATIAAIGFTTGRFETREIFHASSSTDCVIVSRGTHVSIDCWTVEGEHEHGNE
jgi:ABC-type spermidine/putrescine transport system permease subunit II